MSMDMTQDTYIKPTNAISHKSDKVLTDVQVNQWRKNGFTLVNGVIPEQLAHSVVKDASSILSKVPAGDASWDQRGLLEFPTASSTINELSLHPRLLTAVSQLLNTKDFQMKQADLWKKVGQVPKEMYGDYENVDQRIHMDFPNHTFVHPPRWSNPSAVEIIIYFNDCNECGGSTAVVPKENDDDPAYIWPYCNMPGFGSLKWINNRKRAERYIKNRDVEISEFRAKLYKREKYVYFQPGTILFYRYDLWHRGTPLIPGKVRWIQNMAFCKDSVDWVGNWNRSATFSMYVCKDNYDGIVEKMIANLSPFQRSVIGFPKVGSSYWDKYTLEAVRQRYEPLGMDISPYKVAIQSKL
eukprot:46185_1